MEELNRRNTSTVEQALKNIYHKIEEQEIRINGLNAGLASMQERLNTLERMLLLEKVKSVGTGPSVK